MSNEVEIVTRHPRFRRSIDTDVLYKRLVNVKIGETITYTELSALIGRDVQISGSSILQSARRIALNKDNILFDTITNHGIKRLNDVEKVNTAVSSLRRIQAAAKTGAKKVSSVDDFELLPSEQKFKHNAYLSIFNAIVYSAQQKTVQKIEQSIEIQNGKLSLNKTLDFFKK